MNYYCKLLLQIPGPTPYSVVLLVSPSCGQRYYTLNTIIKFLQFNYSFEFITTPSTNTTFPSPPLLSPLQVPTKKLKKFEKEYQTLRESQLQQEDPIDRYQVRNRLLRYLNYCSRISLLLPPILTSPVRQISDPV